MKLKVSGERTCLRLSFDWCRAHPSIVQRHTQHLCCLSSDKKGFQTCENINRASTQTWRSKVLCQLRTAFVSSKGPTIAPFQAPAFIMYTKTIERQIPRHLSLKIRKKPARMNQPHIQRTGMPNKTTAQHLVSLESH